jgi:Bacterial capsule synthesis protein PGA_cap
MVDAGADMFVGHGPHVLRGIEIYKGKPILYSLGDFIFENETLQRLPSENYETSDLGAAAHVNDFNDRRYNFDKSGFPADRLIWEADVAVAKFAASRSPNSRCTRSRSDSANPAACAGGRCSPRASSG